MVKKRVTKKAGATAKKKVNKSKAIRDYKAANADAGPKEIAAALTKERIRVSPAFVSTVLSTSKKKKGKSRRVGRPRRAKPTQAAASFTASELMQAKKLAEEIGGLEKAKAAIDVLSKIS